MSLRTRRTLALLTAGLLVAGACTTQPPATEPPGTPGQPTPGQPTPGQPTPGQPSPGEPTPGQPTPGEPTPGEPTPGESPQGEQELVYPTDGQITFLNNALSDVPTSEVVQWIHEGLYQYNEALEPVPALADGEAEISEDGLTWTLRLKENAVFMPGEIPVTADDVVFTYEMALNPNCRFNPDLCATVAAELPDPDSGELVRVIESVTALDEHTVEFVLNMPYAPMLTSVLPGVAIDSRQAVEEAFADFRTGAEAVPEEEINDLVDRITAEEEEPTGEPDPEDPDAGPTVNLEQFRGELEDILTRAGLELPVSATFPDDQSYLNALVTQLRDLQGVRQAEEADRIAAAYPLLETSRQPVGAGPFYVTEFQPGNRLTLTANPLYHEGPPALARILVPIITDAVASASALQAGDIDWEFSIESDQFAQVQNDPNIKLAEYADFAYFGVQYNLHEEHDPPLLFTDHNLRLAAAHCLDKPAAVDAATSGQGITIWADIPPASWAYNPDVPTYEFNPELANQLIQDSGWVMNETTGVYEKEGRELGTHVPLRAGQPDRIAYMQLWQDSLNENCGFNITLAEYDFGTQLIPMLVEYPHLNPDGSGRPFEAYFGGWGTAFDPDPRSLWHSSNCSNEEQPDTFNYICFQNEEADQIIDQQAVELDFEARRDLLWRFEEILATELPYDFAWSPIGREGLRTTVNSVDQEWTPDNMDSPTWFWEYHKITNQVQR